MTIDDIINDLDDMKTPENGVWVVKHEGKILTMNSGKSSWKRKNHASAALTNCIEGKYRYQVMDELKKSLGLNRNDSLGQYLIKQGIVTVEQL